MPWSFEYRRAQQVVVLWMPDGVEVWALMDYLAANFQRPNAAADARLDAVIEKQEWAARVAGLPARTKGKR